MSTTPRQKHQQKLTSASFVVPFAASIEEPKDCYGRNLTPEFRW